MNQHFYTTEYAAQKRFLIQFHYTLFHSSYVIIHRHEKKEKQLSKQKRFSSRLNPSRTPLQNTYKSPDSSECVISTISVWMIVKEQKEYRFTRKTNSSRNLSILITRKNFHSFVDSITLFFPYFVDDIDYTTICILYIIERRILPWFFFII